MDWLQRLTERIARPASLLVFVMMLVTTWEVVGRYVFNRPTMWAWPMNRQIFGVFILIAGAYTMAKREHIRIEILYDNMPAKIRFCARMLALVCFLAFMGVLVWQATWMGWNSFKSRELLAGAFRIPLYPFKIMIPIGAFYFLVQGVAVLARRDE